MAISTFAGNDVREGIISRADALSLSLNEDKIRDIISKRITGGEAFYNSEKESGLNLKAVREENEKRWLNKNREVSKEDLYDFQCDYRDNRIFVSVETLTANMVSRIPMPEVVEANDTPASRELADNYSKVLFRKAQDVFLKGKLQMIARHLLIGYRVGIMKIGWDFDAGRLVNGEFTGDIFVNYIRPHKIICDAYAEDPDNIPLIAESLSGTLEEFGLQFPKKKDALFKAVGAREGKRGMATRISPYEVWFSFYDDDGIKREGVCWKYGNVILDYGLNPNFNYEEDEGKSNFFPQPRKPYVFFNFLRLGKWIYDDTSLTEQAANQQDVLEKRGRQIVENADQANATRVFNIMMVNAKDAQKYTGDPNQNILAKGNVREAFARVPAPSLPRYVVEDKLDARREIDNIFGTHAPLRGEKTASPTLGQEVMSQQADIGRVVTLGEAMEKGAGQVFQHMTQIFKVFATKEHIVRYLGEETGSTTFINFSRDKIEDGIEIRVLPGSMKAEDKTTDKTEAVELAKIGGRIDPLSFFEKWHSDKPLEKAKRLFYFMFMPDRYAQEVLKIGEGGGDQEAMQTIQRINSGESVPPKENPTKEYLAYYNQFIKSPAFKELDSEVQRLHIAHLRGTVESAKSGLKEPTGEEKERPGLMERIRGLFKK